MFLQAANLQVDRVSCSGCVSCGDKKGGEDSQMFQEMRCSSEMKLITRGKNRMNSIEVNRRARNCFKQ